MALTRDIGTMSNRIMEMTDKIIVMADNIGTMSGRIVDTETAVDVRLLEHVLEMLHGPGASRCD